MNRRVILDTSVLVSAALRVGSVPHKALQQAIATCDLCASSDTLDELDRVLDRKKFDLYLDRETRRAFVLLIRRHVHLFAVAAPPLASLEPSCRDPNDDKFLALAQMSAANVLVSSDDDLLILNPWHSITIMTPHQFLSTTSAT